MNAPAQIRPNSRARNPMMNSGIILPVMIKDRFHVGISTATGGTVSVSSSRPRFPISFSVKREVFPAELEHLQIVFLADLFEGRVLQLQEKRFGIEQHPGEAVGGFLFPGR